MWCTADLSLWFDVRKIVLHPDNGWLLKINAGAWSILPERAISGCSFFFSLIPSLFDLTKMCTWRNVLRSLNIGLLKKGFNCFPWLWSVCQQESVTQHMLGLMIWIDRALLVHLICSMSSAFDSSVFLRLTYSHLSKSLRKEEGVTPKPLLLSSFKKTQKTAYPLWPISQPSIISFHVVLLPDAFHSLFCVVRSVFTQAFKTNWQENLKAFDMS